MALQKNLTLDNGVNLPEGYIKITSVNVVVGRWVDIDVEIFKDRGAFDDKKQSVIKFSHRCSTQYYTYFGLDVLDQVDINLIGQCYNYLKTLPFYSSAIDVMDVKE